MLVTQYFSVLHFSGIDFVPISVALGIASKKIYAKLIYFILAIIMVFGNMVTLSRGGFLGLVATAVFMIWKLSKGFMIMDNFTGNIIYSKANVTTPTAQQFVFGIKMDNFLLKNIG